MGICWCHTPRGWAARRERSGLPGRKEEEGIGKDGIGERREGAGPGGREQQTYIVSALAGEESSDWFRSAESGRAIVAVAQPVVRVAT